MSYQINDKYIAIYFVCTARSSLMRNINLILSLIGNNNNKKYSIGISIFAAIEHNNNYVFYYHCFCRNDKCCRILSLIENNNYYNKRHYIATYHYWYSMLTYGLDQLNKCNWISEYVSYNNQSYLQSNIFEKQKYDSFENADKYI